MSVVFLGSELAPFVSVTGRIRPKCVQFEYNIIFWIAFVRFTCHLQGLSKLDAMAQSASYKYFSLSNKNFKFWKSIFCRFDFFINEKNESKLIFFKSLYHVISSLIFLPTIRIIFLKIYVQYYI